MDEQPTGSAQFVEIGAGVKLECSMAEPPASTSPVTIVAAHPADAFSSATAALLARIAGAKVVCINPRGIGGSSPDVACALDDMVDDLERARQRLELGPIVFWGMSGGGWLAISYARRHRHALSGVILESACACFRARLFDEACALSPRFPAWRAALESRGLVPQAIAVPNAARDAEWIAVEGVGDVLCARAGAALLVAPAPLSAAMKRAMPAFFEFDARSDLAELDLPALVLAGSADPIVPLARTRAVHEALSGSRFVAIEGGGHVPSASGDETAKRALREFLEHLPA